MRRFSIHARNPGDAEEHFETFATEEAARAALDALPDDLGREYAYVTEDDDHGDAIREVAARKKGGTA